MSAQALVLNLDPLGSAPAAAAGAGGASTADSCPAAVLHDMLALPQQPQPQAAAGPSQQALDRVPEGMGAAAMAAAAAREVWAPPGGEVAGGWNAALRAALAQPALRARVNALHDRGALAEIRWVLCESRLSCIRIVQSRLFMSRSVLSATLRRVAFLYSCLLG